MSSCNRNCDQGKTCPARRHDTDEMAGMPHHQHLGLVGEPGPTPGEAFAKALGWALATLFFAVLANVAWEVVK